MNLYEMKQSGFCVLRPSGQLGSGNSAEFEREVRNRIEAGNTKIVIDFGDLDYISSAGLRVLLVLAKTLKTDGGTLALCSMNSTVAEVFEVTGFSAILPIHQSLDEALLSG
ncbi:MAG: STAS domain-containing protein [Pseudomonadota bacterium]